MLILGIDPGKTGGAVIINQDSVFGRVIEDHFDLIEYLRDMMIQGGEATDLICGLEKAQSFPGDGRVSMFSYGTNYGQWQGVLDSFGVPYELIAPQKWRKIIGTTEKGKEPVVAYARRKWPDAPIKLKKDWWIADALCIAEWVRQKGVWDTPAKFAHS